MLGCRQVEGGGIPLPGLITFEDRDKNRVRKLGPYLPKHVSQSCKDHYQEDCSSHSQAFSSPDYFAACFSFIAFFFFFRINYNSLGDILPKQYVPQITAAIHSNQSLSRCRHTFRLRAAKASRLGTAAYTSGWWTWFFGELYTHLRGVSTEPHFSQFIYKINNTIQTHTVTLPHSYPPE